MAIEVQDSFTAPNGTNLDGYTADVGGDWYEHPASNTNPLVTIQNNEAAGIWDLFGVLANDQSISSADQYAQVDMRRLGSATGNAGYGLAVRVDPINDTFYVARMNNSIIRVRKGVNGTYTTIGSDVNYTTVNGGEYRMRMEAEGTTIRVQVINLSNGNYVNSSGSEQASPTFCHVITDSDITGAGTTNIGMVSRLSLAAFDDFEGGSLSTEYTESVSSTLSLSQELNAVGADASSSIGLAQSVVPFIIFNDREVPENTLSLVQEVALEGLINGLSQNLSLSQSATATILSGDNGVDNDLNLDQEVTVVFGVPHSAPWGVAGIEQDLGISQGLAAEAPISTVISFTQEVVASYGLDSEITFTQEVSAGIGYTIEQDLDVSQTVSRGGSEWNRSATSNMALTSAGNGWDANDKCFRRVGDSSGPTASGRLTLFSQDGLYSITLRNPETDNVRRSAFDRVVRETRGGNLIVYRDASWKTIRTLLFTIVALKRETIDNLQTFFLDTLGEEIILVDWLGEEWSGVVTKPDETFTEDDDGYWTFAFEFEGNKRSGSSTAQNLSLTSTASATVV